jgi:hypothetical protein
MTEQTELLDAPRQRLATIVLDAVGQHASPELEARESAREQRAITAAQPLLALENGVEIGLGDPALRELAAVA